MEFKVLLSLPYFLFIFCCTGNDLLPYLSWSNSDILTDWKPTQNFNKNQFNNIKEQFDFIVIFSSKKLTFDNIAQSGIFSKQANGHLRHLKHIISSSKSHFWTAYEYSTNWQSIIDNLSVQTGLNVRYMYVNADDIQEDATLNGIMVVSIESDDIKVHDKIIWSMMMKIHHRKMSYLAMYTGDINKNIVGDKKIDRRFVSSESHTDNGKCQIGGVFNSSNTSSPCMLFCLSKNITFVLDVNDPDTYCSLHTPLEISWCCTSDLNMTSNCTDELIPFLTLHYVIQNETENANGNVCSKKAFQNFLPRPEGPRFENAEPQILVYLKFLFPINGRTWKIAINASYTKMWLTEEEPEPQNVPGDDEDEGILSKYSITERQSADARLYEPFVINAGLSYSCSSNIYNNYSAVANETGTVNGSTVIIKKIQVQPYSVSSSVFAFSDDCIGYTTYVSWMGIISIGILVLILYVSVVAAFSIKSIDSFEDSREETIKVEKLH